ncbi:mRNA capping enzyme, alpha subunit [Annulohypoxylon maeteangense]|uniref:mRNA capping enzyme, alpha subunit n=1 Tax=Annulohypoxylon maeteangense TaxID=1927788 RepID=UPI0020082618|nr:mRNA capping enzyme, alpha subunit [Annulohypoxylon maeteangense]KAI0887221.1 mRNA capping enzyme, alpha subunit [Annulohypoxylon maeteangense]
MTLPIQSIDEPGRRPPPEVAMVLRQEVASILHRNSTAFPGAQPVSFTRKHLDELLRDDYYVCEKSDGIRYLLYLAADEGNNECHYFIDRKNDYWYIDEGSLHFPLPGNLQAFHKGTILDGELVMDAHSDGRMEPRYLVFDCLAMDGQSLMSRELSKRLGYFQEQVFKPYKKLLDDFPEERQFQPFFLDLKSMQMAYGIRMIFEDVIKNLKHDNDGLIFTALHSEYKPGTDPHILKWKDAEENTVDFKWRLKFPIVEPDEQDRAEGITEPFIDFDSTPPVELHANYGNGKYGFFAPLHLEDDEWEILKGLEEPLDDRVVEVYMDNQKRWRFYRFRDDKSDGNHISVVNSVIESIQDAVTRDELENHSKNVRDNWKARDKAKARK